MNWDTVAAKFDQLAERHLDADQRARIKDAVGALEELQVEDLTRLLEITSTQTRRQT